MAKILPWADIVSIIKKDAEEMDYVVDFLNQIDSLDGSCYIYFKDDDQSAVYVLNDQHRAQLEDALTYCGAENQVNVFWSELNEHYRMTS